MSAPATTIALRPHDLDDPRVEDVALSNLRLDGQGPMWLQIRRTLAQPILKGDWRPEPASPPRWI